MNSSIIDKLNEKIICQQHDNESLNFILLGAAGGKVLCGSCTLTENYIQIRQKLAPMLMDYKKQLRTSIPEDETVSKQLQCGCELVSAKLCELEEYMKRWKDTQLQLVEAHRQQAVKCIDRNVEKCNAAILNWKKKVAAYENLLSDPIDNICKNYQPNYPNLKHLASFLKDKIVVQKINEESQFIWSHLEQQFVDKQKAKDKINQILQSLDKSFVKSSLNMAFKNPLLQNLDVQLLNKYIWDFKSDPSIIPSQASFFQFILDDITKLKMKKLYSHLLNVYDLSTCSNQLKIFLDSQSIRSLDTQTLLLCQLQNCGNEFKTLGLNISLIANHLRQTAKWQLNYAKINNSDIMQTSTLVFFDNMRSYCYVQDGIIQLIRDQQPTQLIPSQQDLKNSTRPNILSLSVSYDGQYLASGGEDMNVVIWDLNTSEQISILSGHQNEIHAVAFSSDGKLLASSEGIVNIYQSKASQSYAILIWDLKEQSLLRKLDIDNQPCKALAFSPNGKYFAAASQQERNPKICLWMIEKDWEPTKLSGHKKSIRTLIFSPDSRFLASGGGEENQPLRIWDTQILSQIARFGPNFQEYKFILGINFSADSKYVAFSYHNEIQIWRIHSNSEAPEATQSNISSIDQVVFLQKFGSNQSQNLDTLILELGVSQNILPKNIKLLNNSAITLHFDSTLKKTKKQ